MGCHLWTVLRRKVTARYRECTVYPCATRAILQPDAVLHCGRRDICHPTGDKKWVKLHHGRRNWTTMIDICRPPTPTYGARHSTGVWGPGRGHESLLRCQNISEWGLVIAWSISICYWIHHSNYQVRIYNVQMYQTLDCILLIKMR